MKSTKELLHQIHDPNRSTDERAQARCRLAKQLEEVGNYENAREAMGELWGNVGDAPNLENFDRRTAGEVLLRIGALTGWLGSTKQIEGGQETAKNLISKSIAIFEELQDGKKVSEAQTEIALCYERQGALEEARVLLAEALTRLDDHDGDLKAVALLRSGVLEQIANRLNDALNVLRPAAPLFEASRNHTLKGRFHNEFGLVLRKLGSIENRRDYIDQALIEYSAASFHFEQGGHARYQACVENNLAFLFGTIGKFSEAHEHLDRAQALFTRLNDNVHLAQVEETRARVMLAEGAVTKAEKIARSAVQMLEKGGEPSLLSETLTTHGTALARLRERDNAHAIFQRAIVIAEQAGDYESAGLAALTLFEELAEQLSDDEMCASLGRAHELLKNTKNAAIRDRLMNSAFRALSMIHTFRPDWTGFSLEETLNRHEAHYIQMALDDVGGVITRGAITRAARLLGLSRQILDYILKTRHENLRNVLTASAGQEAVPDERLSSSVSEVVRQNVREFRILHVEDDLTVAGLVREIVEHEGWTIKQSIEGTAALEELASDAEYDLLLVDHDLPGLSGLELIEQVRSIFHRRYMPIVMMSGTLDEATAREAGADAFLRKPQDIGVLVQTINRVREHREREG
jgi:CheY-like chemotaxis protein